MSSLAVCTLVGHLTRDAELKFTAGGMACSHFSIATDKRKKKGEQWVETPSFWDVTLWGKQAESVNQFLTKGKLVTVYGEMEIDQWEQDGQRREKTKITAQTVQLLSGTTGETKAPEKPRETQGNTQHDPLASTGKPVYQKAQPAAADDFIDDIPF